MYRKRTYILLACMMALLCACGRSNVSDDIASEYTSNETENEEAQTDEEIAMATEIEKSDIPEHFEYTIVDDSNNKFIIDADVSADGYDRMQVINVKEQEINEDFLIGLAGNIFDEGKYDILQPYFVMEKSDIECDDFYEDPTMIENIKMTAKKYATEETVRNYVENKVFYDYTADDQLVRADFSGIYYRGSITDDQRQIARIAGKIGGKDFELMCVLSSIEKTPRIIIYQVNPKTVTHGMNDQETVTLPDSFNDNDVDEAKAAKTADDFIKKMGFDGYELKKSYPRVIGDIRKSNEKYLDGYVFYYVPTFDGLNSYYSMTNTVYLYSNNTETDTPQSAVRIEVAEEGLYEIRMINCYQKDGEPQKVEKLLEFDQAVDSLETYLHNEVGSFGGNVPYDISKIKLEYVLVSDENGTAYVPEWVFYTHMQSAVTPNAYIAVGAINAIDGSISLMDAATNMYFMY
ncbi:MAG: hypothetical protein K6G69_07945 [Lachnospiraceae bacterium]|nr:hypothetical protein [Lachnospiraceae bacterium]